DRIHSLDDFLALLRGVKPGRDGEYRALCPGHDDHEPSLSVKEADGKILLQCFAGCGLVDILKPLKLEVKDLFLNDHNPKVKSQKRLVATFSYEIEKGEEAFQIRRYDLGNGKKTFEAWHRTGDRKVDGMLIQGRYLRGMGKYKKNPVLFHLPEIKEWVKTGKTIYLPEGEAKAELIIKNGGAATTSPFGAGHGKWRPQYSDMLAGAKVVILPDNDYDFIVYEKELGDLGITVESVSEPGDASTPAGYISRRMMQIISAWYSKNLAIEVKKGLQKKVENGGWPKQAPFGYVNKRDKNSSWIEVDPKNGPFVTEAFREFATGNWTLRSWADHAYSLGYRSRKGNPIAPSKWSDIFHHRFYLGETWFKDGEVPIKGPTHR
ncbi:MAG: recombinase family protein, partial [Dehalococcoidales bacterium]|nr:recombinase family protein [Dehalococcoidales bacterium]